MHKLPEEPFAAVGQHHATLGGRAEQLAARSQLLVSPGDDRLVLPA